MDHYLFDKKLRLILLNEIEKLEIAFRSLICNTYALKHGSHWYLDGKHFNDSNLHNKFIAAIVEYCNETSDLFIRSYLSKYSTPTHPAVWMIFEILTFGQLASLFENLKDTDEKKIVAGELGIVVPILESWLKSINYIRNCCAHHSRLWNRKIPLKPVIPVRKGKRFLSIVDGDTNKRIYGIISCMLFLMNNINPKSKFKDRLRALFDEFPTINKAYMGFHEKWKEEELWGET